MPFESFGQAIHNAPGDARRAALADANPAKLARQEESLRGPGLEMHLVGDCLSPRTAEEAIDEGLMAARKV